MWLHTTLNYQYKHGVHFRSAIRSLWKEGGVPRFYRGLGFALMLAPASRFVDTAANAGCLALLSEYPATANLPVAVRDLFLFFGSLSVIVCVLSNVLRTL